MKRHSKLTVIVTGSVVLALAFILAWNWEDIYLEIYAYRTGWRFVWMPLNVVPGVRKCLNNSGNVAATWEEFNRTRLGLWSLSERSFHLIDTFPETDIWVCPAAINDQDSIIGAIANQPWHRGVVAYRPRGFIWSPKEGLIKIPMGDRQTLYPSAINNSGTVIGCTDDGKMPFAYRVHSSLESLNAIDNEIKWVLAINKQEWVLGYSGTPSLPFLLKLKEGIQIDLGAPPGHSYGFGIDLNDRGEALVVGRDNPSGRGYTMSGSPFIWTEKTGYVPISTPEPKNTLVIIPITINNRGDILLSSRKIINDSPIDYYIIRNRQLQKLPSASDGRLSTYTALNDNGWVAGFTGDSWGDQSIRGFVALPVR